MEYILYSYDFFPYFQDLVNYIFDIFYFIFGIWLVEYFSFLRFSLPLVLYLYNINENWTFNLTYVSHS